MDELRAIQPDDEEGPLLAAALLRDMLPSWGHRAACAGMPTQDWFRDERECLEWAYESEKDAHDPWSESTDADNDRYGVFGGSPGRIRERFARYPDCVDRCLAWFDSMARSPDRRWLTPLDEPEPAAVSVPSPKNRTWREEA